MRPQSVRLRTARAACLACRDCTFELQGCKYLPSLGPAYGCKVARPGPCALAARVGACLRAWQAAVNLGAGNPGCSRKAGGVRYRHLKLIVILYILIRLVTQQLSGRIAFSSATTAWLKAPGGLGAIAWTL